MVPPYNHLLIMHGDEDKNVVVSSCDEFVREFGQGAGLEQAFRALDQTGGLLYVMQARAFDDLKLAEAEAFCQNEVYQINCVTEEETSDVQQWMIKLAKSINATAFISNPDILEWALQRDRPVPVELSTGSLSEIAKAFGVPESSLEPVTTTQVSRNDDLLGEGDDHER